ncbi:MAG: DUF1846 domain-containing protein, partial [Lentisphaerae bacterium]|nr:DUF1846 domain-containing protein [Lentisphaerota bacterium]
LERIERFGNKLYLEFGGKLLYDYHASRVLPGFHPNVKMRLLQRLRDKVEIVLCIYAGDIERRKMRADFGITYDADAFKLIDDLRDWELDVRAVVITRYTGEPGAASFKTKLERRGVDVYTHSPIPGYPTDINLIVGDDGFGANPFISTTKPLVVVTAPGPNSGKMGTCLSQIFHEHTRGIHAGYAKFETFPIWNLPVRHPVNAAYEAATADLMDVNLVDPFHLEATGESATNYNRDVAAFPLLRRILERITGDVSMYSSPTDMGVNHAGFAIVDDEAARDASKHEIIRRFFRCSIEYAVGQADAESVHRIKGLMEEFGVSPNDRSVVSPSQDVALAAEEKNDGRTSGPYVGAAMELADGRIVSGKNSGLFHAASALILNATKVLAGLPKELDLLSQNIIESIASLKKDILGRQSLNLDLRETLIALSISSTTNPTAQLAMQQLKNLRGCEVHLTHIPTPGDEKALRRLGVNLTCSPQFASNKLFVS